MLINKKYPISFFYLFIFSLLFFGTFQSLEKNTFALSGSSFSAGRIIDDSIFYTKNSLSVNDIQNVLNSKVPTCDTNGTQMYGGTTRASYGISKGYPPPFTCLKDYSMNVQSISNASDDLCPGNIVGGTKNSARIIYEISQLCGINSKVLIVLLQKEQTLVTDDWPWSIQYRSATGYGCPDTAPCDSEFYGFFNQTYQAARAFKRYQANPNSYNYRAGYNNNILFNPNASCGSSSIFIENQATAGLYIYTPYQPNQSALNNLYGLGDGCSAYGNRNFWRIFNDWFGPTTGPLVRTESSGALFYSDGEKKYPVGSMQMAEQYGLGLQDVRFVSQQELDALQLSPKLSVVTKSDSDTDDDGGNLYLISSGKRQLITSMQQFYDFGFELSQIGSLPLSQLTRMPLHGNLNYYTRGQNGYLFKIETGKKRAILDLQTFSDVNPSGNFSDINNFILDNIQIGSPIIVGTNLLKDSSTGKLWLVKDDTWHYIPSMDIYSCIGQPYYKIRGSVFGSSQAKPGTLGTTTNCIIKNSVNQTYILDGNRKILSNASWGLNSTFTLDDSFINRLPTYSPTATPVFKTQNNGALFIFESGKKRQILSMAGFGQFGYTNNDIFTSTTNFLSTIQIGPKKLHSGLAVTDSSKKIFIINNENKIYVTSMNLYYSYGHTNPPSIILNTSDTTAYPELGNLKNIAKFPAPYLIDESTKYSISSDLENSFGVSPSTPLYSSNLLNKISSTKTATKYLKSKNGSTLYVIENGSKRPVYSWTLFNQMGGNLNNITTLSDSTINSIPTGPTF